MGVSLRVQPEYTQSCHDHLRAISSTDNSKVTHCLLHTYVHGCTSQQLAAFATTSTVAPFDFYASTIDICFHSLSVNYIPTDGGNWWHNSMPYTHETI